MPIVLCPSSVAKKKTSGDYIATTGKKQKEALRICKTTDYGQLTTDV
jgi:hypothetical protein